MSYEDNDGKTQVYNPQAYGSNDRTQTFSASDETQQATVADAPALHELFPEHEDADATVVAPGAQAARIRTAHAQHSPYASQATQNYATQNPYGATQNFASQNPYGVQATQNISSQSPYGQGGDGNDSGDGKKDKGMFSDISFAQVTATALAAVTSTLLSSQIGIAGSIIGVGLGAAASAVATSIYKNILSRSADKLKSLKDSGEEQIEGVMDSSELGSYEIGPDGQRIASDSMLAAADSQRKRQKRIAIAVTSIAAVAASRCICARRIAAVRQFPDFFQIGRADGNRPVIPGILADGMGSHRKRSVQSGYRNFITVSCLLIAVFICINHACFHRNQSG